MKQLTPYLHYLLLTCALIVCTASIQAQVNDADTAVMLQNKTTLVAKIDAALQVQNLAANTIDSITFFQLCSSFTNETLTFINATTTAATNTSYKISWGDGSADFVSSSWATKSHNYSAGHWVLKYTVTGQTGETTTKTYHIYIVSNPAISLGSPGNTDNCSNIPLTFPITGTEKNPPGTTYTVTFNDGSAPIVFTKAPPSEITHVFTKTSCGITSYNGATTYPNSFSASIVASNSCGTSAVNVVPIYISTSPEVNFDLPKTAAATNKPIYITNTTTGYVNNGANCAVVPKLVWKITPATGFTLSSGSLGDDNNSDNSNLWTKGSDIISPVFTVPGTYTIALRVDTKRCGNDSIVKTICIEAPLVPTFEVQTSAQCTPVQVSTKNLTSLATTCSSTTKWTVVYVPENCGTAPAEWAYTSGSTDLSNSPSFNFVTPGTYKIVLSMTNTAGTISSEQTVIVKKPPTAEIQLIPDYCGKASIHPIANVKSCSPQTTGMTYLWSFPGGSPSSANTLDPGDISYSTVGNYTAILTITNECGSVTTNSNSFNVNPLPTIEQVANLLNNRNELTPEIIFNGTAGAIFEWTNNNPSIGLPKSGTGNILPFSVQNNGNSILSATIKVTPKITATGCVGDTMLFLIQVNPLAVVNNIENQHVNNTEFTKKIDFSSPQTEGVVSFKWTNDKPEIGLASSGTGNISSFTAKNNTTAPLVATIWVTPVFENGGKSASGTPKMCTITVNPTAQVNPLTDLEFCNGINTGSIEFSSVNSLGITTFSWTNDNPNIGLSTNGTGNIPSFTLNNKSSNMVIATITVVPTFTYLGVSNIGKPEQLQISVNPGPTITSQPTSSSICQGAAISPLSVSYTGGVGNPSYQWYVSKNNTTAGANAIKDATTHVYTPVTDAAGINYYFCVITLPSGICSSVSSAIAAITVSEGTMITKQAPKLQNLCVGGSIPAPLSVKYINGSGTPSYQWYSNSTNSNYGGTAILNATDSSYMPPVFTKAGEYYYYLQLTLSGNGCGSVLSQVSEVRVVSDPEVMEQPIASQVICKDFSPTNLTVTVSGGLGSYNYQWFENSVNDNGSGKAIIGQNSNSFSPLTALVGTCYYYCVISQPSGINCLVTSQTAQVTVSSTPTIALQPISATICEGEKLNALTVKCVYQHGIPSYQWYSSPNNSTNNSILIPGANNSTFVPDSSKTGTSYYYCSINFSVDGCAQLTSNIAAVTINAVPKINSQKLVVANGTLFTITPNELGGDKIPMGTNYYWSNPVVSPANSVNGAIAQSIPGNELNFKLSNLTDSIATVTYKITALTSSCVGSTFTVEVRVLPNLLANATVKNISCFDANNGSIQTNISGGIPFSDGYHVQWIGPSEFTSTAKDISGLIPGEYQLTVTDVGGYPIIFHYTILQPTQMHINTDTKRDVNCTNNNNGKLAVTVSGGIAPYNYSWKKDGVYFANTKDISDLEHGVYLLTVTDANDCELATESYNIAEPAMIDIKLLNKSDIHCFGDSTGSISVEVKGGTIIENSLGISNYNYTWSGPTGFMSFEKNIKHLIAGTYKLNVTDANGCNQTLEVELTQPEALTVATELSPINCHGANNASINLKISGGTKPYQISWSNLGTGLFQQNLSPGEYSITVTDAQACMRTAKVLVLDADFSIHPMVKNISCFGANDGSIKLNITGGLQNVKLTWKDNPTAGNTRNQLSPGIYTVTLRDSAPCEITESFLISEPGQIQITGKIRNAFACESSTSGSIDMEVTGGTAPYTYKWSNNSDKEDLTNISAGKYYVIVTDAQGCSGTAQFELTRQLAVSVTVSNLLSFDCQLKKMKRTFKAHISGGFPPYQITWSAGAVSGANNEIMQTCESSLVEVRVTDSIGCTTYTTLNAEVPTIEIQHEFADCSKFNFQFYASKANIELNDMSYYWNFGDGETSKTKNPLHTYSQPGNYKITLTIATITCSATLEETITIDAKSRLMLDKEPKFCMGDSVELKITGSNLYRWSDGTIGEKNTIKRTGLYTVIGTNTAGCNDTLSFTASNFDLYNYSIQSDSDKISSGGYPLHLWSQNIPYTQYYWDFGDGKTDKGADVYHSFSTANNGYYDVKLTATSPTGCTETATKRIWITVPVLPNTFSPNGDGINEKFLENWQIKVYSRNGIIIYDGHDGWDGNYKGQPISNGIYFYVLYYPSPTGTKTSSGYVRVIR